MRGDKSAPRKNTEFPLSASPLAFLLSLRAFALRANEDSWVVAEITDSISLLQNSVPLGWADEPFTTLRTVHRVVPIGDGALECASFWPAASNDALPASAGLTVSPVREECSREGQHPRAPANVSSSACSSLKDCMALFFAGGHARTAQGGVGVCRGRRPLPAIQSKTQAQAANAARCADASSCSTASKTRMVVDATACACSPPESLVLPFPLSQKLVIVSLATPDPAVSKTARFAPFVREFALEAKKRLVAAGEFGVPGADPVPAVVAAGRSGWGDPPPQKVTAAGGVGWDSWGVRSEGEPAPPVCLSLNSPPFCGEAVRRLSGSGGADSPCDSSTLQGLSVAPWGEPLSTASPQPCRGAAAGVWGHSSQAQAKPPAYLFPQHHQHQHPPQPPPLTGSWVARIASAEADTGAGWTSAVSAEVERQSHWTQR